MVLSSQVARPHSLRRFSATRRRSHALRNVIVAGSVLALGAWWFWPEDQKLTSDDRGAVNTAPASAGPLMPGDGDFTDAKRSLAAQQKSILDEAARQSAFARSIRNQDVTSTWGTGPAASADAAALSRLFSAQSQPQTGTHNRDAVRSSIIPTAPLPSKSADASAKNDDGPRTDSQSAPAASKAPTDPKDPASPRIDSNTFALGPTPSLAVSEMVGRLQLTSPSTPGTAGATLREGMNQIADGKLIEGRRTLSHVLTSGDPSITASDARTIRDTLASINKSLVFSDRVLDNDTLAETYTIVSGDLLSKVAGKYKITYQLIEQINNIDARRVRVGQKIKVMKGPFHVVVDKSDYRMDIYATDTDGRRIYITSFAVGVGKDDSTPIGSFICKAGGKLENPGWTHPRTGQHYGPDDPANPIGEYWIALQGTDEHTKGVRGYGIHGTIEPESVGKQASLGCVRMVAKDIEQVYKLLTDGHSTVTIQP